MPKPSARTYSRYSLQASALLGSLIRESRIEASLTAEALAQAGPAVAGSASLGRGA